MKLSFTYLFGTERTREMHYKRGGKVASIYETGDDLTPEEYAEAKASLQAFARSCHHLNHTKSKHYEPKMGTSRRN